MIEILSVPDFAKDYQDKSEDAYLAAERVNAWLGATDNGQRSIQTIQVIDAGFYQNCDKNECNYKEYEWSRP
jgi:hypothetical protein